MTGDAYQFIIVQEKLAQGLEVLKLVTVNLFELVVLQKKALEADEVLESLRTEAGHLAVVQVQGGDSFTTHKAGAIHIRQVVAIQSDLRSIHGDEEGHFGVASEAALNDIGVPGGIVEASAAIRALHSTIAGKEFATHALGEAMGGIRTKEVLRGGH